MQCSKCEKRKDLTEYSFRNVSDKIYYLYCNTCRNETKEIQQKYKDKAVENYNLIKIINKIECSCGITYVSYREFHTIRHLNSKKHKKLSELKG